MEIQTAKTTTRTPSTISRDLEFFSESELTKQLCYTRDHWPLVILAELIDNALDHVEEIGRLPEITVELAEHSLRVTDNGNGIPESVIQGLLDFDTRTSSRVSYKTPTRGAQGNAGKCLVSMPYVWGDGYVEITVNGATSAIRASVDEVDRRPIVDRQFVQSEKSSTCHTACPIDGTAGIENVQTGSSVTVVLPDMDLALGYEEGWMLLAKYSTVNPHASFKLLTPYKTYEFPRTSDHLRKWTAAKSDPVDWYSLADFRDRVLTAVSADRKRGKDRTIASFVSEFAGFARSDNRSELLEKTKLHRANLSEVVATDKIEELYGQMCAMTSRTQPKSLGRIGRSHIFSMFELFDGFDEKYKYIDGWTTGGVPFVLEVAFAHATLDDRVIISAVNGASDICSPSMQCVEAILEANELPDYSGDVVIVSLRQPAPVFKTRGKTELDIDPNVQNSLRTALDSVLKEHVREVKARERDEYRAENAAKRKAKGDAETMSMKDAIWELLPQSIDAISLDGKVRFDARSHYYWMREAVQSLVGGKVLTQKYLDKVIDEWESENGVIETRDRDARGFLYEPHSGRKIPLGTREVSAYQFPDNQFHNILYVEKKGLMSILQHFEIAERYDIGIVAAEGFAPRASQALMQQAARAHGMKVIVLHDADPSGYGIADALGRDSGAHKYNYSVIDAGLTISEAVAMGLPSENFERTYSLQKHIAWTPIELEFFTGKEVQYSKRSGSQAKKWVECRRVELNAISANPERFVEWVEGKLQTHGCALKLVPDRSTVISEALAEFKVSLENEVRKQVNLKLKVDDLVRAAISDVQLPSFTRVPTNLKKWAKSLQPDSWRSVVADIAERKIESNAAEISGAVQSAIKRANLDLGD